MSTWGTYSIRLRQQRLEDIRRRQEEQRRERVRREAAGLLAETRRTNRQLLNHMAQHFGRHAQQQAETLAQQARQSLRSDPDKALMLARQSLATAERGIGEASVRVYQWSREKTASEEAVAVMRLALDSLLNDSTRHENGDKELVVVADQLAAAKAALRREDFQTARQLAVTGQQHIRTVEQSRQQQQEQEAVRREVVRGLRHVLTEMGFTVKPAHMGRNGEEGKVVLAGHLPSGRTARFVIALDGQVQYDFDGYTNHNPDCGKDCERIRRELEEQCQAETSDIEIHRKGPNRISRNALDLPTNQRGQLM